MAEAEQRAADRINGLTVREFKVYENRLRRMAARQGMTLHKYSTRDKRALNYGCYYLEQDCVVVAGERMQIDDVERYLTR